MTVVPSRRISRHVIADEMLALARQIEEIATAFCRDEALCQRHGQLLQQFDEIAQAQTLLAQLLASDDASSVPVTIEKLALRLQAGA